MYRKTVTAAVICLIAGPVLAATPGLDARQHNERARIAQGVHSGELTRAETARLVRGQRHLQGMERRAKSDGVVNARERTRLARQSGVQSRRIFVQKHDPQPR